MRWITLALLFLAFVTASPATSSDNIIDAPFLKQNFETYGVPPEEGTFVLYQPSNNQYTVYNLKRARERFTPASTFKIPHSLIGLETGAISSIDEVFPYDGKPRELPIWEKTMDLREAMKVSCVPIFQTIARRIGKKRMKEWIDRLHYGNEDISGPIDGFWLGSSLRISAMEQAKFLARLAEGKLPVSSKTVADVKELLVLEKMPEYTLYGKTGYHPPVGWWVGWLEKDGQIYTVAVNIRMTDLKDAPKRLAIAKACMQQLGIL